MAITFSNATSWSGTVNPRTVPTTFVAGDTGLAFIVIPATSSVSTITGGGVWSQITQSINSNLKMELWATAASGVTASATQVTVTYAAALTDACAMVACYKGVVALGSSSFSPKNINNPVVSKIITDDGNYMVAGFGWNDGNAASAGTFGTLRDNDGNVTAGGGIVDATATTSGSAVSASINHSLSSGLGIAGYLELRARTSGSVTGSGGKAYNNPNFNGLIWPMANRTIITQFTGVIYPRPHVVK